VIVDQKGAGNLLYLPLDKLMQQSAVAPPNDGPQVPRSSQPAAPEPPAVAEPPRTRDGLRSRER
jgi:membrane protease subunit HflK